MFLVHVFISGHEFIGKVESLDEKDWTNDWLILHEAVKCFYHNSPNGLIMNMQSLKTDNNYDGRVKIKVGAGFFLTFLENLGNLAKKYHQACSSLVLPELKMHPGGMHRN